MKVTTVSASVRFSGALGDSRFKTIELSAEATLDGKETWTEAQATLYQQLGCQLKALWANGAGQKAQDGAEEPTEAASEPEPPQVPTQPPEHHCQSIKRRSSGTAGKRMRGTATRRLRGSGVGESRLTSAYCTLYDRCSG